MPDYCKNLDRAIELAAAALHDPKDKDDQHNTKEGPFELSNEEKELDQFLMNLSPSELMDLMTVMYIGRDYLKIFKDQSMEKDDDIAENDTPDNEESFMDYVDSYRQGISFGPHRVNVLQMTEKWPLPAYLKMGKRCFMEKM